jgi:hypothetical protein
LADVPIRGDQQTFSQLVKLETMKGALQMSFMDFTETQLDAAVRAAVDSAADLLICIPPENQLLTKTNDTNWLLPHLPRFKDNVPLIADHIYLQEE